MKTYTLAQWLALPPPPDGTHFDYENESDCLYESLEEVAQRHVNEAYDDAGASDSEVDLDECRIIPVLTPLRVHGGFSGGTDDAAFDLKKTFEAWLRQNYTRADRGHHIVFHTDDLLPIMEKWLGQCVGYYLDWTSQIVTSVREMQSLLNLKFKSEDDE